MTSYGVIFGDYEWVVSEWEIVGVWVSAWVSVCVNDWVNEWLSKCVSEWVGVQSEWVFSEYNLTGIKKKEKKKEKRKPCRPMHPQSRAMPKTTQFHPPVNTNQKQNQKHPTFGKRKKNTSTVDGYVQYLCNVKSSHPSTTYMRQWTLQALAR